MAIAKTDIKLMESKRMDDTDAGGGVVTGQEIADGVVNNMFPNISRLDRTLGRVSLIKAFIKIATATRDKYFGSHVIISEPQTDDGVNVIMVNLQDDFDERLEAAGIIQGDASLDSAVDTFWENYPVAGAGTEGDLSAYMTSKDASESVAAIMPQFAVGKTFSIAGTSYSVDSIMASPISFRASTTPVLAANAAVGALVADEIGVEDWEVSVAATAGDNGVYIKIKNYHPAIGDTVILQGQSLEVSNAVSGIEWYKPLYTFTKPLLNTLTDTDIMQQYPENLNTKYYGVTKLSVNALLNDSTITLADTKKFIFPLNSDGIDPALVGLDAASLPVDKLVPIIDKNNVIVIHSTTEEAITNPAVAATTYPLTGTDYQLIELRDQNEVQVNPALYTVDLVAGSVTMAAAIDLSPYVQPLVAHKRYEDMRLVTDVDHVTKVVSLGRPLGQAFTAANTFVSSAVVFGDILSSYGSFFDQATWTDVWQDTVIGSNAGGTYNDVAYPVEVTNAGCVTERWALEFTSDTAFNIIGENVGQIGTGVTNSAGGTFTEPLNPETGLPYFRLPQEGWGSGWSVGNVLRFNTIGCTKPVWFIRVTQQGDDTLDLTDKFTVQIRGDVN